MSRQARPIRGFSLIEVAISTLIVGVLLVGAMQGLGVFVRGRQNLADDGRASLLAHHLMAEVLAKAYVEPAEPPTFGPEPAESGGTRVAYDDVDDFHGWNVSPPQELDGTVIPGMSGWRETVTVEYVEPSDASVTAGGDQGMKRVTVVISRDGKELDRLVMIRSSAWQEPPHED